MLGAIIMALPLFLREAYAMLLLLQKLCYWEQYKCLRHLDCVWSIRIAGSNFNAYSILLLPQAIISGSINCWSFAFPTQGKSKDSFDAWVNMRVHTGSPAPTHTLSQTRSRTRMTHAIPHIIRSIICSIYHLHTHVMCVRMQYISFANICMQLGILPYGQMPSVDIDIFALQIFESTR